MQWLLDNWQLVAPAVLGILVLFFPQFKPLLAQFGALLVKLGGGNTPAPQPEPQLIPIPNAVDARRSMVERVVEALKAEAENAPESASLAAAKDLVVKLVAEKKIGKARELLNFLEKLEAEDEPVAVP